MKTYLPFTDFYLVDFEIDTIQGIEEREIEIDYKKVAEEIAKQYSSFVSDFFGFTLSFDRVYFPREYNFDKEEIICDVNIKDIKNLLKDSEVYKVFEKIAYEELKPRSGFIPFYSYNPQAWGKVDKWNKAQIELLLRAKVLTEYESLDVFCDEIFNKINIFEIVYNNIVE